MSGPGADGLFEVAVEPHNDQYDPDDDRWRDQVATLYEDLHAQVDTIRRGRPVSGTKGTVDQLIIALGSAGAFHAAVDCFRAWLGRDRDRRIDIKWDENGAERSVTLTGEAVDAATMREIGKAAVARVGGPPWPAGTVPS
jgi:membrane-associated two-gene conflict system component 1 (EACC1)